MPRHTLSPEQHRVAASLVARGGYRDTDDAVANALHALQARETARAALLASVHDAAAEGERDGQATAESLETEMRQVIRDAARSGA